MSKKVIICRCEEVSLEEIKELLEKGIDTVEEIKRILRLGMGPCGGKTCTNLIINELAKYKNVRPEDIETPKFRPPAKNIKLGLLAMDGDRI